MLRGFLTVAVAFLICLAIGAVFGVLVGAVAGDFLLWIGILAMIGGGFGIAVGYGFLPES